MEQNRSAKIMSKEAFVLEAVSSALHNHESFGFTLKQAGWGRKEYGISRTTMYHALKNLETDGYFKRTGKTWYPTRKLRELFYRSTL